MDEEKVRQIIREELTRTIEVEKASRPGEEPPREGKIFEKTEVNVLDWLCSYLPYIEGALRGLQADINKTNNHVSGKLAPALEALSKILIENESNIKEVAKLATKLKPILEIGYNESTSKRRLDHKSDD